MAIRPVAGGSKQTTMSSNIPPEMLTIACKTRNLGQVKIAIMQGAQPNDETLEWAIKSEDPQIVQAALSSGAQPNSQSLTLACGIRDIAVLNAVAMRGGKPNANTLTAAIKSRDPQKVMFVESLGAQPDQETLSAAIQFDYPTANQPDIYKFIQRGCMADANTFDIFIQKFKENSVMLNLYTPLLIAQGARPNQTKTTALTSSLCSGIKLETVKAVIQAGARGDSYTIPRWLRIWENFTLSNEFYSILEAVLKAGATVSKETINVVERWDKDKSDKKQILALFKKH